MSDGFPVKIKIRYCPKCGLPPRHYTEIWEGHTISFEAEGGMMEDKGNMEPGYPVRVRADCSCGHSWTIRGISSKSELEIEE